MKSKERKYVTHKIGESVHTGNMLKALFAKRRIRKNALARHLNRGISTLVNFQKNSTIQTAILWEISVVLKHNFFMDIACLLPADFATEAPVHTEQSDRIIELEQQLKIVIAERDVLMKTMSNRL